MNTVQYLSAKMQWSSQTTEKVFDTLIDLIEKELLDGNNLQFSGFGQLETKSLSGRRTVFFKPSVDLTSTSCKDLSYLEDAVRVRLGDESQDLPDGFVTEIFTHLKQLLIEEGKINLGSVGTFQYQKRESTNPKIDFILSLVFRQKLNNSSVSSVPVQQKIQSISEKATEILNPPREEEKATEILNPPREEKATKIFNPPKEETRERPIFQTQQKNKKRFPWEWILCTLALFGVGWFYYTVESREKRELESIRATFIPPAKKEKVPNPTEGLADSMLVISNNPTVAADHRNSSRPAMLLRDSVVAKEDTLTLVAEPSTITTTVVSNAQQPKVRKIGAKENLRLLALEEYGHESFWIYLYLENKNNISNPNKILIGSKIVIPPAAKYGIDKNDPESIRKAKELARQN